jgi:hypothetical protein
MADMQGGTFTISNGGVYGSLMSTPILNAPQSGILGMHKIQERPVVVDGQIVIRPMMYLALSYDHRIVDGKEAVTFLVRVKESLEDPERLVLYVAPLCPVGHLPHKGGDHARHRRRSSCNVGDWRKPSRPADLPPCGGDVRQDRGGQRRRR